MRYKDGDLYTTKPCYCAIANNYPSGLNCAAITTPLKLNSAITKYPLRLKITAYPALSTAINTTPFGDIITCAIWCGVSNGIISD